MLLALVHGRQSNHLRGWRPIAIVGMALAWVGLCAVPWAAGQAWRGEIRVRVQDPNGHPMAASVVLSSEANHVHHSLQTGLDGTDFRELPFGVYRLLLQGEGFSDYTELIEVRTAYPLERQVMLKVQPERTSVPVTDRATLLDPGETGAV